MEHRLEIRKTAAGKTFYIDGSLQFDSRDEAIYHETLSLPGKEIAIARFRKSVVAPTNVGAGLDALVLGGGDGLVLKRLLDGTATQGPQVSAGGQCPRHLMSRRLVVPEAMPTTGTAPLAPQVPGVIRTAGTAVRRVKLVDYDENVIALARNEFIDFNNNSLNDPRVKIYIQDAVRYIRAEKSVFDLIVSDFTFPCDLETCSLFTRSFFSAVRKRLSSKGILAMNAVSPELSPAAFWSIYRTLISANLFPRPLRISIPSFRSHGYGDWGMFLASPFPIKDRELKAICFGNGNSWINAERLHKALCFDVTQIKSGLPLSRIIRKPGDLLCLINLQEQVDSGGIVVDFADSLSAKKLISSLPGSESLWWHQLASEWEWRLMQTLHCIDWAFFLEELEKNAGAVSGKVKEEISLLRINLSELLQGAVPRTDRAWTVFAALMVVLVFVNMAYPDNAYAKGGFTSRGGQGSYDFDKDIVFFSQRNPSPFRNRRLQRQKVLWTLDTKMEMFSTTDTPYKPPKLYTEPPKLYTGPDGLIHDKVYFALSDESFVSKNGEIFFTFGQSDFLINARPDMFVLFDKLSPEPVFEFYPDNSVIQTAFGSIELYKKAADKAVSDYAKWLAWAGPASVISREIRAHVNESKNISSIMESLEKASKLLQGSPGSSFPRPEIPSSWFCLAPGLYLADDREFIIIGKEGILFSYPYTDASTLMYAPLQKNAQMDKYITAILRSRLWRSSPNDPKRGVLEVWAKKTFENQVKQKEPKTSNPVPPLREDRSFY